MNFLFKTFQIICLILWQMTPLQSLTPNQEELDDILRKHAAAMGGKNIWANLESYQRIAEKSDGRKVILTCQMPNKITIRFEYQNETVIKGYDGAFGYLVRNQSFESMRPGEAKEMDEEPAYYSELIFAKDKNYEMEYRGLDSIDGIRCHKITLQKSTSDTQWYWISSETYLIVQTGESSEDKAHAGIFYKTRLLDYREVDGYMFPFEEWLIANDRPPRKSKAQSIFVNLPRNELNFDYEPHSTANLIKYWKARYATERLQSLSFDQETIRYDSLGRSIDTSVWYEAIKYPKLFRIDFNEKPSSNTNIYRNDSVYVIRRDSLVRINKQIQEFMILEGALYTEPLDSTLGMLRDSGIDPEIFSETNYNGRRTYIIGAPPNTFTKPQMWVDAENRYVVRRWSRSRDGSLMEVRYEDFMVLEGHWIETWLEFYQRGRLIQTEKYFNLKVNKELDDRIFQHSHYKNHYWY